jgi:hypothetical protein
MTFSQLVWTTSSKQTMVVCIALAASACSFFGKKDQEATPPENATAQAVPAPTADGKSLAQAAPAQATPTPAPAPWKVIEAKGKVTVAGKAAAVDMVLAANAEVVTGAKSHALLSVGEGSIIEVRENSRLVLGSSPRKKISAKLVAGRIWSFFEKPTDFEVVTENAVAGVRGTVVYADVTQKDKTAICACKGVVHVAEVGPDGAAPAGAFDKDVDGHEWEHRAIIFTKKGGKVQAKEFPPGKPPNHTAKQADEILKVLHAQK